MDKPKYYKFSKGSHGNGCKYSIVETKLDSYVPIQYLLVKSCQERVYWMICLQDIRQWFKIYCRNLSIDKNRKGLCVIIIVKLTKKTSLLKNLLNGSILRGSSPLLRQGFSRAVQTPFWLG